MVGFRFGFENRFRFGPREDCRLAGWVVVFLFVDIHSWILSAFYAVRRENFSERDVDALRLKAGERIFGRYVQ